MGGSRFILIRVPISSDKKQESMYGLFVHRCREEAVSGGSTVFHLRTEKLRDSGSQPSDRHLWDRQQVIRLKSKVRFIESQIKGVKRQGPTPGVRFTEVSVL